MAEEEQLTRFERARIIGARALQIARGAPILVKTEAVDPIRIAEAEFAAGVVPLKVRQKPPAKLHTV